jgi:NADP-reducing hydrogenase subunit HndA
VRFVIYFTAIKGGSSYMNSTKSTVPFKGTPEQEAQLLAVIEEKKDTQGALMPILQKAQEIYGYLPIEVQTIISDKTGIPLEKIYGVVTFYAQFSLYPKGEYTISVCLGTACYVKGSGDIYNKLQEKLGIAGGECTPDGKFSLEACRCIGACGLAPVLTVNEDVYGRLTVDDVEKILAKYSA